MLFALTADVSPVLDSAIALVIRFFNLHFEVWGVTLYVGDLFLFALLLDVVIMLIRGVFDE